MLNRNKLRPSGPLVSYANFNFDVNLLVYEQNILGFSSQSLRKSSVIFKQILKIFAILASSRRMFGNPLALGTTFGEFSEIVGKIRQTESSENRFKRIISYLLRFSHRIDRMTNSYRNFLIQSQSRNDFLNRGKSSSFNQKSAVKMTQSFTTHSRCYWRHCNLHSQEFVEFPQV